MRIPLSWLKELVPLNISVQEVAERLIRLGHEVESIETPRADIAGVVVGHILSMMPHPNADRLQLLRVDIGTDEPLSIVCGASNMKVGDKVPVATIGTRLPGGMVIKKGKIRGETSYGMCCSAAELGLAEDADGLLILSEDAPVGSEVGAYLGLEEAIIDLSITPNRGDCMSVRGIARELAADLDLPLARVGDVELSVDDAVAKPGVRVEDPGHVPCYMARRIEGLRVGDAPEWMRRGLAYAGMRSVNGVVDVLNYVMLYLGQPMHAFDASRLEGELKVRRARKGETLDALDGHHYELTADDLVVADDHTVVAMAGIIGSEASGVSGDTTEVVLESAFFRPACISTSRRQHGLVSESSMRFERGVDPSMVGPALEQATKILIDLFGGRAGPVLCLGDPAELAAGRTIRCQRSELEERLGRQIPREADCVLERMGFRVRLVDDLMEVHAPAFRHDIAIPEDLAEEYARILGYDSIPSMMPALKACKVQKKEAQLDHAVAAGAIQCITYAFISEDEQRHFVKDDGRDLRLVNPISEDMSLMRRSLWPGLLRVARHNMNRQQPGVFLTELGRIYEAADQAHHREHRILAWLMCGEVHRDEWYSPARMADFFDLKGAIEDWFDAVGLKGRFLADDGIVGLQPGQSARIMVGKQGVGVLGRIDQSIAAAYGLEVAVFAAWVDLDVLPQSRQPRFVPLPEFPSVQRDVVMLFDRSIAADTLVQTAAKAAGPLLADVYVFDVYTGKGIPEDKRSVGFRLTLQDASRTLTQEQADDLVRKVVDALTSQHGGQLR
ncbi:MAG: phenylalanine--tRNA ligase subunit beta [Zetaproteobacteria bacterium]|nr:MAG: phenylalanine--tRNA ligase subunit beta [Zetaproteobacteria bacterium]